MWTLENLNAIHFELSSKCNAACPGCPRFIFNSPNVNKNLVQQDISFENFQSWLSPYILKKIKNWIFCGTHGDPMTCRDLLDIIAYVCKFSPGSIQINTNGGIRNERFYKTLGEILYTASKKDGISREVVFSLDGLSDTNHIYRRNVKWEKAFSNLKSFAKTGAKTAWDYLRFYYNNHQIDEARALAKSLNVEFRLKNPFGVEQYSMPVYNKDFKKEYNILHYTGFPIISYTPSTTDYVAPLPDNTKEDGYIDCNSFRALPPPKHDQKMVEIYIDHTGSIYPCCFVGGSANTLPFAPVISEIKKIKKKIGNNNNLHYNSLENILNNNKVLDIFSKSWKEKTIKKCFLECGIKQNKQRAVDDLFVERNKENVME